MASRPPNDWLNTSLLAFLNITNALSQPVGLHRSCQTPPAEILSRQPKRGGRGDTKLMEGLMQSRFTPLFFFIACFSLIGAAGGDEGAGDAKAVRKIVRAADG